MNYSLVCFLVRFVPPKTKPTQMPDNSRFISYLNHQFQPIQLFKHCGMQPKVVISWWAPLSDFEREEKRSQINKFGPNYEFHQYFFSESEGYEKHIILCSKAQENTAFEFLLNTLRRDFPSHQIEGRYMGLSEEEIIDFAPIKAKVEPVLFEHRDYQIDLFFSPGTSAMSVVWFMLHQQLGLRTCLLQTTKSQESPEQQPRRKFLNIERATELGSFILKEGRSRQEMSRSQLPEDHVLLSPALERVYNQAFKVAQAERGTIIIQGASGSGKELLAQFIHSKSPRSKQPFIAVNCAAFSDSLLESRLFGHAKGSFTGASQEHKGYFEQADKGSIFLDEIGDISPQMQQTLLRVLQSGEIAPIGQQIRKVDVRIIVATNQDLVQLCQAGKFRWDLYYRLAIAELELPSLDEQGQAAKELYLKHFVEQKRQLYCRQKPIQFEKKAYRELLNYRFPGNIRELESLVERFYVLGLEEVTNQDFPKRLHLMQQLFLDSLRLEDVKAQHIKMVYERMQGNQTATARVLGVAINTIRKYLDLS